MNTMYLFGFIAPFLYAISNIIDEKIVNVNFKNISSAVFFANIGNLLFFPLIFFISTPNIPTTQGFIYISLIAIAEIFYLYPYYKALRKIDTSIVTSLFFLTDIFLPILAFLFLGEVLNPDQYIGFFIIIFSSIALSIDRSSKFKINTGFFYMFTAAALVTAQSLLYSKSLQTDDWVTVSFWSLLLSTIFLIPILFKKENRKDIIKKGKKSYKIFAFNEFLEFGGLIAGIILRRFIPLTVLEGLSGAEPIFVLIIGYILYKLNIYKGKELFSKKDVTKKLICFSFILFGMYLII